MDLRTFLLEQTRRDEQSGALGEIEGARQRRDIVHHTDNHICSEPRGDGRAEIRVDAVADAWDSEEPVWCDWLRDLATRYADREGYQDSWRPYSDQYWDHLDENPHAHYGPTADYGHDVCGERWSNGEHRCRRQVDHLGPCVCACSASR